MANASRKRDLRVSIIGLVLVGLAASPRPANAGPRDPAPAFKAFAKLAADDVADEDRQAAFTKAGLAKERDHDGALIRGGLLTEIAGAKSVKAREKGDEAVVSFKAEGDERGVVREVPLRRVGGEWKLDAPRSYVVRGPDLDDRTNKRTAKASLAIRTGGGYKGSAYCFANATGDPDDCLGRMDLWICHNNDIHRSGGARIVSLGKTALDAVDGIPVGVEWSEGTVPIEAGHTYVVHCRSSGRRDFYVKLRITKVTRTGVEIEWTLLTTGFNAPKSIYEAVKIESGDGADGTDGLCGKAAR